MAGGKVSEWIRKRTMPRRKKASRGSSASAPILEEVTGSGTSTPVPRKAARSSATAGAPLARSKISVVLRWRPSANLLAKLYDKLVYHLLWLVESVVVVATLCFFLMRFGFKQL